LDDGMGVEGVDEVHGERSGDEAGDEADESID
jgi:hypothetical protein